MRLIINADDLGISSHCNDSIFALMDRGVVTSTTIIANAPCLEEALRNIPHFPRCSFGVHLNLTQFEPITRAPVLEPLMDRNNQLQLALFKQIRLNRAVKQAIFTEWCAQVQRVQSLGVRVSHLDSHHDLHTDPRLFLVLKKLQCQLGLRKVRLAKNIYQDPEALPRRTRWWNLALRYCLATQTTGGFTEFSTFMQAARQSNIPYETVELMVHPGHPRFAAETALLSSPWPETLPFPVSFISYHDL